VLDVCFGPRAGRVVLGCAASLITVAVMGSGCASNSQTADTRVLSKLEETLEQTYKIQEKLDRMEAQDAANAARTPQGGGAATVQMNDEMRMQLEAIYGNTQAIAMAVGETRVVAAETCLRARPSPDTQGEPLFCMPGGTPIFRCRDTEVPGWMSGLTFRDGKVYEIYFSVDHTRSYGDWLASQQTDEDRL